MSVTPQFIGQRYKDTNNGNIWKANSLTPGDWTLEVEDLTSTVPSGHSSDLFLALYNSFGRTSLTYHQTTNVGGIDFEADDLVEIHFPNLASFDPSQLGGNSLFIRGASLTTVDLHSLATSSDINISQISNLTTLNLSALTTAVGNLNLRQNTALASLDLHSLVSVPALSQFFIYGCTNLVSLNLAALVPSNGGTLEFIDNALNAASVNQILARCVANAAFVSGLVDLHGGTSSAPTGQGATDKATLNARHAGLAVTN